MRIPANCRTRWVVAVALMLTATPFASAAENMLECYQIIDAKIIVDKNSVKTRFGMANFGHQVGVGKHTVISIRRYDNPEGPPDSQSFFKTTIGLEKIPTTITETQFSEVPVIYSFHSEGNSAFVSKNAFAWSEAPLKKISIKREAGGLRIHFSQDGLAKNAASGKDRLLNITADCTLRKLMVPDLGLWEGRPGTDYQSFYPSIRPD
jgi:hypothetical protein